MLKSVEQLWTPIMYRTKMCLYNNIKQVNTSLSQRDLFDPTKEWPHTPQSYRTGDSPMNATWCHIQKDVCVCICVRGGKGRGVLSALRVDYFIELSMHTV